MEGYQLPAVADHEGRTPSPPRRPPTTEPDDLVTAVAPAAPAAPTSGGRVPGSRTSMFAALGVRNYRYFVPAQVFSTVGLWTQRVAQDWLVLTITGSAAAVGVATALQFVPTLIFGMSAGLVADRFDKRRVLMCTVTVLGLCAAALAVLCLTGTVQLWQVLLVAFVTGTAASYDNPTRQAFIHEIVGGAQLRNAVSLNSAVSQLGGMVGPAVSAALIAAVGIGWSFTASAATYIVVAVTFALIRESELHQAQALARGRGQLRSALSEIRGRPDLLWPLVLAGVVGFFVTNFPVSLAAFAKDFRLGPVGYGFLTTSLAAGSLLGALIFARRPGARQRNLMQLTAAAAVTQLVAAAMPEMVTLCAALVAIGLVCTPFGIASNTTVQLAAGDTMRGRVMGVYMLVLLGAAAAGGPLLGLLDQMISARAELVAGGVVIAAAAVFVCRRWARATHTDVPAEVRAEMARLRSRIATGIGR